MIDFRPEMLAMLRAAQELQEDELEGLADEAVSRFKKSTAYGGFFRNRSFPPFIYVEPGDATSSFVVSGFSCLLTLTFFVTIPFISVAQLWLTPYQHDVACGALMSLVFGITFLCACVAGQIAGGYPHA